MSANFINNTAKSAAGAGAILSGRMVFKNNLCTGNSDGGFYFVSSNVNFSGATSISRNTGRQGGAMQVLAGSYVSFTGHTIFDSNNGESGGAIYASFAITLVFNQSITFAHNTALTDGGAIYSSGANITFLKY